MVAQLMKVRYDNRKGTNRQGLRIPGSGCTQLTTDGQGSVDGVAQHNLDPVWVPVDAVYAPQGAIVYASTRAGRSGHANLSPRYRLPATNLWRMTPDGEDLGQMTFLNGGRSNSAVDSTTSV